MKNKYALIALAILPLSTWAQENKYSSCQRVKSNVIELKSNTLTVGQIAETERYDVHYYFLNLNMTNTTTTLSGVAEIHATARVNLDSALVELYDNFTINTVKVNGVATPYFRADSRVKIPVNASANAPFVLTIDYNGTPPTAATNPLGGGGMTNATSQSWGNQVTWSLSEPFSAYEWFPVKQSLRDKADSSSVFITVPTNCKAGSNGVLQQVVDLGNGTHRFEWKHNHPIDYYLISVAVAKYVEYNVTANPSNSGPVLIQNFIYDNPQTLPNFQDEIDETADFLELFADLYGPYPFADEKYGHCMAPLSGGMEHQTMTTQGFFERGLTAHELAHQWWGDNVTCSSWADIWVNEGFASYSEYLMLQNLYAGQQQGDMLDRHDNVMSEPNGSVWVEDSLDAGRIFSGRLTYDKGASIIHTLRFLINDDDLFFDGLQEYQEVFDDSTASGLDFIHVMENVTNMDFTNFMEEWYFGEGHPTYSTRWNMVNGDLHFQISQTVSAASVTPFFTNDLEIRLDRQGAPDTVIRFDISGTVNQYLIPNPGNVVGVYSIDPANWIINRAGTNTHDPTLGTVGITEGDAEQIHIYPNPSNGPFTVEMPVEGNYSLTVFDAKGRVLKTLTFAKTTVIDLGTEANGAYILQVASPDGARVRRIIKK